MKQSEQTLDSLDGMQRAPMPALLRERIIVAMPPKAGRIIRMGRPRFMLLAAGLALLIGINVYTLTTHKPLETAGARSLKSNPLADEYFSPAPSI